MTQETDPQESNPRTRRLGRLTRGLWPDHNPLRRPCDRAEAAIVAGLLAGLLIGVPLAAFAAGHWVYTVGVQAERAQLAARHQVGAVLLEDAPGQAYTVYGAAVQPQVAARWTALDGTPRVGEITVARDAPAGSTVKIWIDSSGWPTHRPLQHNEVTGRVILAAAFTPVIVGLLVLCAGMLAYGALDRRRLAAWEAEWSETGPQWSRDR